MKKWLPLILNIAGMILAAISGSNGGLIANGAADATLTNAAITGGTGLAAIASLVGATFVKPGATRVDELVAEAARLLILEGRADKAEKLAALVNAELQPKALDKVLDRVAK